MTPLAVLSFAGLWAGTTLLLGTQRWGTRRSLAERFHPAPRSAGGVDVRNELRTLAGPGVVAATERISHLLGISDDTATRLDRIGAADSAESFRLRQVLRAAGAALTTALVAALATTGAAAVVAIGLGAASLVILVEDQRLTSANDRYRQATNAELPIVAEQLAMLLSTGHSVQGSLRHVATRSSGTVSGDLSRVLARIGHGIDVTAALHEWGERSGVDGVTRLVSVLALHREADDLGPLLAAEARSIRRDTHRQLISRLEQRAQMVWIPVTVAALVPGALLVAVPFFQALAAFTQP